MMKEKPENNLFIENYLEPTNFLNEFIVPHIALTLFKYRAKGTALFKSLKLDVTIDQFVILKVLMQFPEIPQQNLADLLYKDKSNFSRMVEDLEKQEYLTRKPEFKGKRVVKSLSITEKGLNLVEKIIPFARELQGIGLEGLSPTELDTLKNILGKIRKNLDNEINIEG